MSNESTISSHTRRNRVIAVAAGGITVAAIVLAFAAGYLGEQWSWLRPAGELLLLAELVGLIILERHQLFEPVHSTVAKTEGHVLGMMQTLTGIAERLDLAGQATLCTGVSEVFRAMTRVWREAASHNLDTMRVLRTSLLSGAIMRLNDAEVAADYHDAMQALAPYFLLPTSPGSSPARHWAVRALVAFADLGAFEAYRNDLLQPIVEQKPLNLDVKFIVWPELVTLLYPIIITDKDTLLTCHDLRSVTPFALLLRGEQYVSVFSHWYDELWASIPNTQLVYSRSGLDEKAIDRIRAQLGN